MKFSKKYFARLLNFSKLVKYCIVISCLKGECRRTTIMLLINHLFIEAVTEFTDPLEIIVLFQTLSNSSHSSI